MTSSFLATRASRNRTRCSSSPSRREALGRSLMSTAASRLSYRALSQVYKRVGWRSYSAQRVDIGILSLRSLRSTSAFRAGAWRRRWRRRRCSSRVEFLESLEQLLMGCLLAGDHTSVGVTFELNRNMAIYQDYRVL